MTDRHGGEESATDTQEMRQEAKNSLSPGKGSFTVWHTPSVPGAGVGKTFASVIQSTGTAGTDCSFPAFVTQGIKRTVLPALVFVMH